MSDFKFIGVGAVVGGEATKFFIAKYDEIVYLVIKQQSATRFDSEKELQKVIIEHGYKWPDMRFSTKAVNF